MKSTMRILTGTRLAVQSVQSPALTPESLQIKVAYAGVNRADLLQKAGVVEEIGSKVRKFQRGDRVAALLSGGGYANTVAVEEELCFPVPTTMTLPEASAIPENWITAYQLIKIADLQHSDSVLVHAAASGVGSALLQFAKVKKCHKIFAVCGSEAKSEFAKKLGATHTFLRHRLSHDDLATEILNETGGSGVDVIFDCVGASTFDLHMKIAAVDARWILYGTLGGLSVPSVSLGRILARRLQLRSTTLRARSFEYRSELIKEFSSAVIPALTDGTFQVQIDRVINWEDAEEALKLLDSNSNRGKLILAVDPNVE